VTSSEEPHGDGERAERWHELVELAPDGILIHDGERIVFANLAAARLAGAKARDDLVGLPIGSLLDPPHLKAVQTALSTASTPVEPAPPVRDTLHRLDGSEVEVEVRAVAFLEEDRPSAHLVLRDISERLAASRARRHMEELLRQAQRREAMGVLAGGVAHEVNNMMAVVLGFCDCLLENPRLPEDAHADVREITKAADHAVAITRHLLAFSRCAIHRPGVIDLGAVVRDAEPSIRRLLGGGRRFVLVADATPPVFADPAQLEQVVVHLALNACDAMPEGGTLTITTADTVFPSGVAAGDAGLVPAGRYATLTVQDTGVGMDAATQARIFEPFFTTKPTGQGTGLGLSAAQGLVAQNRGFLTVSSAPGQGATFTLCLPVYPFEDVVEEHD
jgi:PAS domain S-box-containing protein